MGIARSTKQAYKLFKERSGNTGYKTSFKLNKNAEKAVLQRDGNKCKVCGTENFLEVIHTDDFNHQTIYENREELLKNLSTRCIRCINKI